MNILFVLPSLMRAGAESQTVDLANGLTERGHNVHLFHFEDSSDLKENISPKVTLHYFARQNKLDADLSRHLASTLDQENIQIILGVLAYSVLVSWLARRKSKGKPPIVASLHNTYATNFKAAVQERTVYRWLFRRIEHIIFVCNTQRDIYVNKYRWMRDRSTVVYNGIDEEQFRAPDHESRGAELRTSLNIPIDAFVFSCVAQFRPEKRHDLLIAAFAQLAGEPHLLLAGDGPCRQECERQARKLGLYKRICFLGNVSDPRPVILASRVTVLASSTETFSMAMLESLALGIPMIVSRVGGLPEAVVENQTGRVFQVGDVNMLHRCMQDMIDNPELTKTMGKQSARLVRKRFSREKMIQGTESVLDRVIEQYESR